METEITEITEATIAAIEKLNKNLSPEQVVIRTALAAVVSVGITYTANALIEKLVERRKRKDAKTETHVDTAKIIDL